MTFRTKIKIGNKWYYAERNSKGQFTDITNINKSIVADEKQKGTKGKYKPGKGHITDKS